jgi:hypothetical protein
MEKDKQKQEKNSKLPKGVDFVTLCSSEVGEY